MIAKSKRGAADGGNGSSTLAPLDHFLQHDLSHSPVVESWAEQPWAEFCSGLDKPAFLLPVTGFAEL